MEPVQHKETEIRNEPPHSKLWAMAHAKCPRCYEGDLFKHTAFNLHFREMHEHCPVCGLKYEIEPGFFWGSMYISYALTVGIGIILSVATYILMDDPETWVYLAIIIATLAVLSPFLFRTSRIIMIFFFGSIDYEPNAARRGNRGIKKGPSHLG